MALFRRKQQTSILPDEVNQYYQSQRRERTGVAFMLGLLALVATFLVGLGVFFGGRYLYQKIQGDDDKKAPATVQVDTGANNVELPQIEGNGAPDVTKPTSTGDQEVNTGTSETATAPNPAQTPSLGDEPTVLPATGDEGH